MHVRIREHGRADGMARSFFRAVWPSFERQDITEWHIMHEGLAASVICKGMVSALMDVKISVSVLRASRCFTASGMGRPAKLPRRLR
jgi:hypothetical protein